jgi:hypothetical protein
MTPRFLRPRIAATALLALTALAIGPSPAAAETSGQPSLRCHVATSANNPITFSPKLNLQPRTTHVTGTFRLTACSSPNGSQRRLRSGVLTLRATSRASCSGGSAITGSGTLTWHDASGRRIGTSTLKSTRRSVSGYNPGDALLGGKITRGPLTGARMSGSATPTSNVSRCATSGLRTVTGAGTVSFLR